MKLFKLITSALVAGIVLLFIKQNMAAYTTRIPFTLDLYIREPLNWGHSVYGLIIMSGLGGFVLGFLVLLRPYMHMRRLLAEKRDVAEVAREQEPPPPPPQVDRAVKEAPAPPAQE
ncbi:MAG: hypothetical protein HGB17_03130 [Syntrophobacteraceae bacterium]|nr:hypothetical protein [Syntrophobacteraceae bacterium]